jgi:pantothenate kinase type III
MRELISVLDAGNSHIKGHRVPWQGGLPDWSAGFAPGAQPGPGHRDVLRLGTPDALVRPADLWEQLETRQDPVLVSVIPSFTELFRARFPGGRVVGQVADLPFEHRIRKPEKVGPDRWVNVAAAVGAGLENALIVDAGTATTVDLLLGGVFEGGLIAPGMAFAARCLAEHGALLEMTEFAPRPADVGRDTTEALERGAWLAGIGGVQSMLTRLMEKHGPLPVILTGGLGHHLLTEGRYCDALWTARGAAWWAARI